MSRNVFTRLAQVHGVFLLENSSQEGMPPSWSTANSCVGGRRAEAVKDDGIRCSMNVLTGFTGSAFEAGLGRNQLFDLVRSA